MPRRVRVFLWVGTLLTSCSPAPDAPQPEAVDPPIVVAGARTPVVISGRMFRPRAHADFAAGEVSVAAGHFVARTEDGDLEGVAWVSATELRAVVPDSLAPGLYPLTVMDPDGRMGALADAFRVINPAAGVGSPCLIDSHCDDLAPCNGVETCVGGACAAGQPVSCAHLDGDCVAGVCIPGTGDCRAAPANPNGPCDDGDACTTNDRCGDGNCLPGPVDKDTDGDLFVDAGCPGGTDCRDEVPAVNPGATEGPTPSATCTDGLDNDCDGGADGADDGCETCAELSGSECTLPQVCHASFLVAVDSAMCCPAAQCCPADWVDCAFSHRVSLTVRAGQIDSPQSGFPAYVALADLPASFFATVAPDGADLLVTEADGVTPLPRELEVLDVGAATGALWFGANTIQDGSRFYLYYGNPAATGTDSTAVWDASFLGVWHNADDPSGAAPQITDSTANGVHGTVNGGMPAGARVDGKLGKTLDFDGVDDYVLLEGDTGVLDHTGSGAAMQMTICAWVNPDGLTTSFPTIMSKGDTQYHLKLHSTDRWEFKAGGLWHLSDNAISAPFTQWYHVCGVNTGGTNISYVNGVLQAGSTTPPSIDHAAFPVWMGLDSENTTRDPFDGFIDELKFSNTARDGDWIRAEFRNQDDPGTFWLVGFEESR